MSYKFQERDRLLAGGIVLLLVTAMLVYGVLPAFKSWRALGQQRDLLVLNTRGQDMQLLLQQATAQKKSLRQQLDGVLAQQPPEQLAPQVMSGFERMAEQHKLSLLRVAPGEVTDYAGFSGVAFNLDIQGRYADIFQWLRAIQTEMPYLVLRGLTLSASAESGSDPQLQLQIDASVYRSAAP